MASASGRLLLQDKTFIAGRSPAEGFRARALLASGPAGVNARASETGDGAFLALGAELAAQLLGGDLVARRIVAEGPDVADDCIAEEIGATDICVTQDIPLAGRCLKKGARALSPTGRPFTPNNIGMALAVRDVKAHQRELGEMRGGPPAFTPADRSRFLQALEQAVFRVLPAAVT